MEYVQAKKIEQISLEGVQVLDHVGDVGGTLKSVTLKDQKGNVVQIAYSGYSGIEIYVPKPPQKEKRFVLSGIYKGLKIDEQFVSDYEAKKRKEELDENADLVIEEKMVEI